MLAAAAVDEADRVTKSRRRTIFGFRRRAIEQTKAPPLPGKQMGNFLRRTQAIETEKARHRVWTGCEGVPRLRPKAKAKSQLDRIRSAAVRLRIKRASASLLGIVGAKRRGRSSHSSTPAAKRKAEASMYRAGCFEKMGGADWLLIAIGTLDELIMQCMNEAWIVFGWWGDRWAVGRGRAAPPRGIGCYGWQVGRDLTTICHDSFLGRRGCVDDGRCVVDPG